MHYTYLVVLFCFCQSTRFDTGLEFCCLGVRLTALSLRRVRASRRYREPKSQPMARVLTPGYPALEFQVGHSSQKS